LREKKERKCPCGSGILFSQCCQTAQEGETPSDVKRIIECCVIQTFDSVGQTRGEACLYVARLVKDLLEQFEIKSYVAAGSAAWSGYPHYYQWKPHSLRPEFHAWVVTQYGEIVDLACDGFHTRRDAYRSLGPMSGIPSPQKCWSKQLSDREYIIRDSGAKSLPFDKKAYAIFYPVAIDKLSRFRNG
jgi:hypothetical protein